MQAPPSSMKEYVGRDPRKHASAKFPTALACIVHLGRPARWRMSRLSWPGNVRWLTLTALVWLVTGGGPANSLHISLAGDEPFCPRRLDEGIFFGPAPGSDADFRHLQQLGVQHVIDVRTFSKKSRERERRLATSFGMSYQLCPIGFTPSFPDENIEAALQALRLRPRGTIYVHCSLGRDRTGLLVALYRFRYLGWSASAAFEAMERQEYNGLLVHYDRYYRLSTQFPGCCHSLR